MENLFEARFGTIQRFTREEMRIYVDGENAAGRHTMQEEVRYGRMSAREKEREKKAMILRRSWLWCFALPFKFWGITVRLRLLGKSRSCARVNRVWSETNVPNGVSFRDKLIIQHARIPLTIFYTYSARTEHIFYFARALTHSLALFFTIPFLDIPKSQLFFDGNSYFAR